MRRKIGILILLVFMMAFTTPVVSQDTPEQCHSFSQCYGLCREWRSGDPYHCSRAIQEWDKQKDSSQLLGEAYFQRGRKYAFYGDNKEALYSFSKAALYNNANPDIYFWAGRIYLRLEYFKEAIPHFTTVLRAKKISNETKDAAFLGLSTAYFKTGKQKEARRILHAFKGWHPGKPGNINSALDSLSISPLQGTPKATKELLVAMGYPLNSYAEILHLIFLGILLQAAFNISLLQVRRFLLVALGAYILFLLVFFTTAQLPGGGLNVSNGFFSVALAALIFLIIGAFQFYVLNKQILLCYTVVSAYIVFTTLPEAIRSLNARPCRFSWWF